MQNSNISNTNFAPLPDFAWNEYDQAVLSDNLLKDVEAEKIKETAKSLFNDIQISNFDNPRAFEDLRSRFSSLVKDDKLGLKSKKFLVKALLSILNPRRDILDHMLDKDLISNFRNEQGESILHLAIREGDEFLVQLLINNGANINNPDNNGTTPLMYAIYLNYTNMVIALLDHGAKIELKDKDGSTALHYASDRNRKDLVELLLDRGADINAVREDGLTPLSIASLKGSQSVIRLLIEKGADLEIKHKNGQTALNLALKNGFGDIAEILIEKGADIHTIDSYGNNILYVAAYGGCYDIVKFLLEQKGFDPDLQNKKTLQTPLFSAADQGHVKVMELLIEKGAKVDTKDIKNETPLYFACDKGQIDALVFLLEHGATESVSNSGATLFSTAQGHGYKDIEAILEIGLEPQVRAFLDHKLLSHRFGLDIIVPWNNQKINLSSFLVGNTYNALVNTFKSSQEWLKEAPQIWEDKDTEAILHAIELAYRSIDNRSDSLEKNVDQLFKAYQNDEVIILPISLKGEDNHAVVMVLVKNYFIKGDRAFSIETPNAWYSLAGLLIYQMNNVTHLKDTIKTLLSHPDSKYYKQMEWIKS